MTATGSCCDGCEPEPAGHQPGPGVYVRTRSAGPTTLVCGAGTGVVADAVSRDVFVADPKAGLIDRVSGPGSGEGSDDSAGPAVSSDGRYVAFSSSATNLVPVDRNNTDDVFLVNRAAGGIERVRGDDLRPDEFNGAHERRARPRQTDLEYQ
jgi:hypothetical protein